MFQTFFQDTPFYKAWDKDIGIAVDKHLPAWALVVGGLLAFASIIPIVVVCILRITGLSSPHVDYQPGSPMKRVETNASTHPMMVNDDTVETSFAFPSNSAQAQPGSSNSQSELRQRRSASPRETSDPDRQSNQSI